MESTQGVDFIAASFYESRSWMKEHLLLRGAIYFPFAVVAAIVKFMGWSAEKYGSRRLVLFQVLRSVPSLNHGCWKLVWEGLLFWAGNGLFT